MGNKFQWNAFTVLFKIRFGVRARWCTAQLHTIGSFDDETYQLSLVSLRPRTPPFGCCSYRQAQRAFRLPYWLPSTLLLYLFALVFKISSFGCRLGSFSCSGFTHARTHPIPRRAIGLVGYWSVGPKIGGRPFFSSHSLLATAVSAGVVCGLFVFSSTSIHVCFLFIVILWLVAYWTQSDGRRLPKSADQWSALICFDRIEVEGVSQTGLDACVCLVARGEGVWHLIEDLLPGGFDSWA